MTDPLDDDLRDDDLRDELDEELRFPIRMPADERRRRSVFLDLHAAYHLLTRRLEQLLNDTGTGLSATEATVMVAVAEPPGAAITLSRQATGLHPSTLSSVLDRLERRGLVRRERGHDDHRFVAVWPTVAGRVACDHARGALVELDDELGVHVREDDLRAVGQVSDAANAIGPRGTPPDY